MLIVDSVSKSFDTPRGPLPILDDVSMSLERGQSAAIMGPSGSGKSTLLYIIGALEPPSSGTVTLDGVNPWTLPEAKQAAFRNERVGFVFQDHLLLPQLTAIENVLTPAIVRPEGVTNEIRERGRELLAQELSHRGAIGVRAHYSVDVMTDAAEAAYANLNSRL